jgi:hypothetical protein
MGEGGNAILAEPVSRAGSMLGGALGHVSGIGPKSNVYGR